MNLADIIKGMLAPVVKVERGTECIQVDTFLGTATAYFAYDRSYSGTKSMWVTQRHPSSVEMPQHARTFEVGDIGFAFWREPVRKLRRVA